MPYDLWQNILGIFLTFFAIMNPIANTAAFVSLTGNQERSVQIKIAIKALTLSFIIVLIFALFGKTIFHLFGITLPALKITGGVLIFIIGYQMLHGETSKMHTPHSEFDTDIAISPLAIPLLAGPGTITTTMNFAAAGGWLEISITLITFAALCVITFFFFIFGQKLTKAMGAKSLKIITRLMGLILAVVGTQMLLLGIFEAIDTFSR
jgi:multiple antibiotic resistance protein